MTCNQWRDLILLDSDGTLGEAEGEALKRHVAGCAACRGYAGEVRAVLAMASRARPAGVPAALERQLAYLVAEAPIRRGRLRRTHWWALGAAAAGLAAAAVLAAVFLGRGRAPLGDDDFAGNHIDRALAQIDRDIDRLAGPLRLASSAEFPWPTTTRAMGPAAPTARSGFDEAAARIGSAIEALDRPIFDEAAWTTEEGGEG